MSLGRQTEQQPDLLVTWAEMPRSKGHAFYDRLQAVLRDAGFDLFVEDLCRRFYSQEERDRRGLPPGRYVRMLLVGYFEGIDSERNIEWCCADSLSLRESARLIVNDDWVISIMLSPTIKKCAPLPTEPAHSNI